MKLISKYETIQPREVLDCRIKTMKELVRNYKINLTSYDVMIISRSYAFHYDRVKIPRIDGITAFYPTVSNSDIDCTFLDNLYIPYKIEKIDCSEESWLHMKRLIDNDTPIAFKIDSRFLNETSAKADVNRKINLYYLSTLLLVGYSEEEKKVYVVLTNTNEKEHVTEMSVEDFQKYRGSVCMPFSPEYSCLYIDDTMDLPKIDYHILKKNMIQGIMEITEHMLSQNIILNQKIGKFEGTESYEGISGMKNLRNDLQNMLDSYESSAGKQDSLIRFMLLFVRNNMMFGSYTGFRLEFGKCLKFCEKEYGVEGLNEIGNRFIKLSSFWKRLFVELSSAAHCREDIKEKLKQVISILDKIIYEEEPQYINMLKLLKKRGDYK